MSVDLKWMSCGGVVMDGAGDLAFTASPLETLQDMVITRLKAAFDGWKLYRIGADLERVIGETVQPEIEMRIKRQVETALTRDFLPTGSFIVKTLPSGSEISVFVYMQNTLLATYQVQTKA